MTTSILQRILRRTAQPSSPQSRAPWKAAVAAVALALRANSATAAIVAVFPAIVYFPPSSVVLGQTTSDLRLITFNERQCVLLPINLRTDQGVIPAGTRISSHFVHGQPITNLLLNGKVRFDQPILGVISDSAGLDLTDGPLGAPGVDYPNHPVAMMEANRGFESWQADQYQIIAGGFGLDVTMDVPPNSFSDQIRVLTSCD